MIDNLSPQLEKAPYLHILQSVGKVAEAKGIEAYAIGGVVRDLFLGRHTTDLDFVCVGHGNGLVLAEAASEVLGGQTVHTYPNFGTAAIRIPTKPGSKERIVLEFVGARKESYRQDSRKPIVEAGTLEDDQKRRDFTVNAMGIRLEAARFGEVVDPFNGREHLEVGILKTPLDPNITFEDDPLRMIRAARFAAQLSFSIESSTFAAMCAKAERIRIVSGERIIEEVQKIIACDIPSVGFDLLFRSGLLEHIFPELEALSGVEEIRGHRHKDNFYHTLQVVDNLVELTKKRDRETTPWLRWAALLHDIAKPRTKRFRKLRDGRSMDMKIAAPE